MQQVIEVKNKHMNANIIATNQKPTHNYIKCPINDTTQIFLCSSIQAKLKHIQHWHKTYFYVSKSLTLKTF